MIYIYVCVRVSVYSQHTGVYFVSLGGEGSKMVEVNENNSSNYITRINILFIFAINLCVCLKERTSQLCFLTVGSLGYLQ